MPTTTSERPDKPKQVSVTLSPSTLDKLDALKDDTRRTRSAVIADLAERATELQAAP
jgi:predicted transcriptional regulator